MIHRFWVAACVCVLAPVAQAAAQPAFPRLYRGSINGTLDARDSSQGTTTKASWTITGVVLRRVQVIKSDADWSARYLATGGKLTYHEAETGSCSYTLDAKLPLRTALSKTTAHFALSQSLFFNHATRGLGLMYVKHGYKVSETCAQPDGQPALTLPRPIELPALFNAGEKPVRLGRRFADHNISRDDFDGGSSTVKWSWVLKPGR